MKMHIFYVQRGSSDKTPANDAIRQVRKVNSQFITIP
jgi:hypothetical protein